MAIGGAAPLADASLDRYGPAEFRELCLRAASVGLVVLAIAALWATTIVRPVDAYAPWIVIAGLGLTGALGFGLVRHGALPAATALLVGLVALLTVMLYYYPETAPAPYASLVVVAVAAADARYGLLAAVLGSASLLTVAATRPDLLAPASAAHGLVLAWSVLLLAWLTTRPIRAIAAAARQDYVIARLGLEEVRTHRAELTRLSKSLDAAYLRLERRNAELAEAHAQAEKARRLKAEFAATVGHELRTPINLIVGFSELLFEALDSAAQPDRVLTSRRQDLDVIHRNACHISHLVDDILDLSQVDAHRMALHKESTTLADIAAGAVESVSALAAGQGLSVRLHLPPDLPPIVADPVRIRQVLINLLYNAIRCTRQGGVTISARHDGDAVTMAVADTGAGIPARELPRIFEEYRQVESASRGRGGSGLGLAVCKRFIDLHGGHVWATSTVGSGSTFYFSLPLQPVDVAGSTAPPFRAPASPARFLAIIDVADDAALLLERYLDAYEIALVSDAARITDLFGRDQPWAVLITSEAGAEIWRDICRQRADLSSVPALYCPFRTRRALARALNVRDYLLKPVSRRQLARAIGCLGRPVMDVVIIDDDAELRDLLARMVRSLSPGRRVWEAADGEDGLRLIRARRPDLVVLDLVMAGMSGYAVLEALRGDERLGDVPIIVVTAKGLSEEITAATFQVRRPEPLSVAEAVACIEGALAGLTRRAGRAGAPR